MNPSDPNESPTVLLRQVHRWRMAFFGLVILLAGMTLGAAGTLLLIGPAEWQPPMEPEVATNAMLGRFREELGLTSEQAADIRRILRTRMQKLHEIRTQARPQIEQQLEGMKEEIAAVLTPDQRSRWQGIMGRLEQEFHRGMRRGPGGRGPGFRRGREGGGPPGGHGPGPGRRPRWDRPPEEPFRPRESAGPNDPPPNEPATP